MIFFRLTSRLSTDNLIIFFISLTILIDDPYYSMNWFDKSISQDVMIINELGVHARSAVKIIQIAQNAKSDVWIIRDEEKVNAKNILDILTLACQKGVTITIKIEDHEDKDILKNLVKLVESGFGE